MKRDELKGDEVRGDGVKGDEVKGDEQKCEDERLFIRCKAITICVRIVERRLTVS